MKKILAILLLSGNYCFAQIQIYPSVASQLYCGYAGVATLSNIVLNKDQLHIISAQVNGNINPTITSSDGNSWFFIDSIASGVIRIYLWGFMPTVNSTTDVVNIYFQAPNPTGIKVGYSRIVNVQTGSYGRNAIRQVAKLSDSSSTPYVSMQQLDVRNGVLSFFVNDLNPFSGTAESGWSESFDSGCSSSPPVGFYIMHSVNGNDNTPSITASTSKWVGIAVEFRQSGRRTTIVD